MESKILAIPPLRQHSDSNDCYAVVTTMVYNHYMGTAKSLKEIKTQILKGKDKKQQACKQDPYYYLFANGFTCQHCKFKDSTLNFDFVQFAISENRPIVCLVGAHYILLIGYTRTGAGRKRIIEYHFIDPYVKDVQIYTEAALANGFWVDNIQPGKEEQNGTTKEHLRGYIITKSPDIQCETLKKRGI